MSQSILDPRLVLSIIGLFFLSAHLSAATQHHRLAWDEDPSRNAVVGFSAKGSTINPSLHYGFTTDESTWSTASVTYTRTFRSGLKSHFVRLNNLMVNNPVYYRVCDQDGCGERFWFRTAPSDNSPFVIVAGGDTRTGHTNRRQGNQLVAKLRPLLIMHGGDFTDANNSSQMHNWLEDWTLTYSQDEIDDYAYNRIYPIVPTLGNHEDNDYSTLCKVFGVDYNRDGDCSPDDTYGVVQVSPLLNIYTLNSEFKNSGWSSYATTMNQWLANDLSKNLTPSVWRIAQYHKPMFPHYSSKSDNKVLYHWWSQYFKDYAINLVVESDTHINKITEALVPSEKGYVATDSGGTVFVGEGSWGAPARSANDPKDWTIDLASIQQFKVIQVSRDNLVVRTAQFDKSAEALSWEARNNDSIALPSGVNWWSAHRIGEKLTLVQSPNELSIIDQGAKQPSSPKTERNISRGGE